MPQHGNYGQSSLGVKPLSMGATLFRYMTQIENVTHIFISLSFTSKWSLIACLNVIVISLWKDIFQFTKSSKVQWFRVYKKRLWLPHKYEWHVWIHVSLCFIYRSAGQHSNLPLEYDYAYAVNGDPRKNYTSVRKNRQNAGMSLTYDTIITDNDCYGGVWP